MNFYLFKYNFIGIWVILDVIYLNVLNIGFNYKYSIVYVLFSRASELVR